MRAAALSIGLVIAMVAVAEAGRPKVAVAPLDGDSDDTVSDAIAEAIDSPELSVVPPKQVGKKMSKLGVDADPDPKELRKLEKSLGAVAIISGKLGKGQKGRKQLKLEVYVHGKGGKGFTVEFKSATSKAFKKKIHDEIVSKVGDPGEAEPDEETPKHSLKETDDTSGRHKPKDTDDESTRRKPKDTDDESTRRKPKDTDDESTTRRKPRTEEVADTDEQPSVRKKKRKHRGDSDDDTLATPNPAMTAIYVGAGGAAGQRNLSFDLNKTFMGQPPTVSTGAASGRIQAEMYPLALSTPNSGAAGLGFAAAYDKTVGLSIKIPNMNTSVSIDQSHYSLGARYRFAAGKTAAIAFGLDYERRSYVAQTMGLDMPDVDYTAVAPTASGRVAVASSVVLFGGLDVMLILDTGAIQKNTSYGAANVYGVEGTAGVDIAFTKQIGLRVAGEVSMINFSFRGKGDLTKNRDMDSSTVDVTGATDRSLGLSATLGLYY